MNQLAIDARYGLMFHGKVYATGAEGIQLRISNKAAILEELAREQEEIDHWLFAYSVFCD